MQTDIARKIANLVSGPAFLSESGTFHLMGLIRKMLEHIKGDTKYHLLQFFCDWSLHVRIDRNESAFQILQMMNNTLVEYKDCHNINLVAQKLREVVSLDNFRLEMEKFFDEFNLPKELIKDNVKWGQFLGFLTDIICDCPLAFPQNIRGNAKKIHKTIKGNPLKEGMWVTEISIAKSNKALAKPQTFLNVLTSNTARIMAPLLI